MKASEHMINLPLSFNQLVNLVRQLPENEKIKLSELLLKEAKKDMEDDKTYTHNASENVLAEDWLLREEDEAWKNL